MVGCLFLLICGTVVFSALLLHSCALSVIVKHPEATVKAFVQSHHCGIQQH